jgi:hypothetical protein
MQLETTEALLPKTFPARSAVAASVCAFLRPLRRWLPGRFRGFNTPPGKSPTSGIGFHLIRGGTSSPRPTAGSESSTATDLDRRQSRGLYRCSPRPRSGAKAGNTDHHRLSRRGGAARASHSRGARGPRSWACASFRHHRADGDWRPTGASQEITLELKATSGIAAGRYNAVW